MSVLSPPEPREDERELLIREARARQRRRWFLALGLAAACAGAALAAFAISPAGRSGAREDHDGPSRVAAAPRCRTGQLRLGRPRFDGAYTAHVVDNLTFTNVSPRSCALRGWPALEVVSPDGRRVRARVGHVRNATSSRVVGVRAIVLRPGGAASFHAIEDDGTGLEDICPRPLPSARAVVIPPGSDVPAHRSVAMPYCHEPRRLLVLLSPVVAGRLDRYIFR
jgi:Domain of unknown function (DUF4232)